MIYFLKYIPLSGWVILGITGLFFLVRLYYSLLQIKLIKFNSLALKRDFHPPVSVIIAAKNEAENLQKFLPGILEQDFPEFEVIVVNDGSKDHTGQILESFKKREDKEYFSKLVENNQIAENDYNIAVSSYVEQEDTREKIDIKELNKKIAEIVKKEDELRKTIDEIVADLEG